MLQASQVNLHTELGRKLYLHINAETWLLRCVCVCVCAWLIGGDLGLPAEGL